MRTAFSMTADRKGMRVRYELMEEGERYGLRVSCGAETAEIPDLTTDRKALLELLDAMRRGFVTPATARDIAEDWLLR